MRHVRTILSVCLLFAAMTASARGSIKQTVYMFGLSASFNDSIVYFTPIQEVEAYIAKDKSHFLVNRDEYSSQLQNYFDNRGQLHRTCVTIYDTDKAKLEKRYAKMKEKYTTKSKNKFDVTYLGDDDFKYETVTPDQGTVYVNPEEAEANAQQKPKAKRGKKPKKGDVPPPPHEK